MPNLELINIPLGLETKVQYITAPVIHYLDIRINAINLMYYQKRLAVIIEKSQLIFSPCFSAT